MGGRLWLESRPGEGSHFHFTVPLKIAPAGSSEILPASASVLDGFPLLIVEADATKRRELATVLGKWNADLHFSRSTLEAIGEIERQMTGKQPRRPVVLLGGMQPEMDAFTAVRRIRGNPGMTELPVILLSSSPARGDGARCLELGIDGYLARPFDANKLVEMVASVVVRKAGWERPVLTHHTIREAKKRLRVLVAEDNLVNRTVAARKLEKRGHWVTAVANGAEAVAAFDIARFDVILMDVQMPIMDGLEATSIIRGKELVTGGHVPVIALTAHAMTGDRERCLESGMDDYLTKPFKTSQLFIAVERGLETASVGESNGAQVLNWEALMERIDGDRDLVRQLVTVFHAETPPLVQAIRTAVERADSASIGRAAHRLRGTLTTLGAEAASEPALRLEVLSRERNLTLAPEILTELQTELDRLEPELNRFAERA